LLKQQAMGSRRASMIFAFGSIRWMSPMCRKLFGILSMNRGLSGAVDAACRQYFSPSAKSSRRQLGKHRRIARIVGIRIAALQAQDEPRDVASSCVPSTCECEARICSSRVEPERGRPTMKIGSRSGSAPAVARREEIARADLDLQAVLRSMARPIAAFGSLQRIAALVVFEGFGVLAAVLERLAEREAQVIAIDERVPRRRLGRAHRAISSSSKR
jgi:hypothetical protein